jgi:hypothetical protein
MPRKTAPICGSDPYGPDGFRQRSDLFETWSIR